MVWRKNTKVNHRKMIVKIDEDGRPSADEGTVPMYYLINAEHPPSIMPYWLYHRWTNHKQNDVARNTSRILLDLFFFFNFFTALQSNSHIMQQSSQSTRKEKTRS